METYLIPTKIVGVTFDNRQEYINQLKEGDILTIEADPENPYDKNAHTIRNHNGQILGHIKKELAKSLVDKKASGEKILGISEWNKTGLTQPTQGVNIMIKMECAK